MPEIEGSPKRETDNSRVSPTAWGVAYLRTFSDIPFTKEIFEALEAQRLADGTPNFAEEMMKAPLAPQLEARYKLVDRLITKVGSDQVLEIGSGLAPRGLNFTWTNPTITYVDTDLASMIADKKRIFASMGISLPDNLVLRPGDALSSDDMQATTAAFSPDKPVVIVNEGLMRYLNFDQKTKYAQSVRAILERFGGAWVTPDISLRSAMAREDEVASGHIHKLQKMTGVDLSQNVFESEDQAEEFFAELGFTVERHNFLEVSDELVSPTKLGMSAEQVTRLNGPCPAFVMRLT